MNINENSNLRINIDGTYAIVDSVEKSFYHIFDLLKEFVDKKISKLSNKDKLDNLINDVKKSFEELNNILKNSKYFEREYIYFQDIYLFSSYLFDKNIITPHNIELISEMMNLYFDIIYLKTKIESDKYQKYFEEFIKKFNKCKQTFYTKIYTPPNDYDEKSLTEIRHLLLNMGEK